MRHFKVVIEHHDDGFVVYPVGLRGIVVGQGDTLDEALADVRSALQFHLETFDAELDEDETLRPSSPADPVVLATVISSVRIT